MHVGHNIQTHYRMSNNGKAYTVTETDKERDGSIDHKQSTVKIEDKKAELSQR